MKYYILAGEASGDLHGSNLIKEIHKKDQKAEVRCYGGDLMEQAGATLVGHYKDRAFMGFAEIFKNLSKILKIIKDCKADILAYQPDALIFIDNSGFNLRIAKWAKPLGLKTFYYISPQVWASRAGRVEKIKQTIDKMYVVLPFVKSFYEQYNYPVTYVGHPLIDAIKNYNFSAKEAFLKEYKLDQRPIIALLPGSRKQEITKMLNVMLSLTSHYKEYQFVIAGAPSQEEAFYKNLMSSDDVTLLKNRTYDLLNVSKAALVTSGTATLETALFHVPQVVCYNGSKLSYAIAKRIVKLKYISLVNLIMDKKVVTELIQDDFNEKQLADEFASILEDTSRGKMLNDYKILQDKLGGEGASKKVASDIFKLLSS